MSPLDYDDDDDDDNTPVWPTWAVGTLFRGARCIHISRVYFHITSPSLRSRSTLRAKSTLWYVDKFLKVLSPFEGNKVGK
jgi:hypothetical protein